MPSSLTPVPSKNPAPSEVVPAEDTARPDDAAKEVAEHLQVAARLRAITDHIPALIAYLDTEQRYQFVNEAYRAWFGLDPAEMIGRTVEEVFGTAVAAHMQTRIARVLTGETVHLETELQMGEDTRFVDATYVPDRGVDGVVCGFYVTVNDITAREHSERALRELTTLQVAILDSANFAIMTTDLQGVIWSFNFTAEQWLGYRQEEVIGHATPALFHDPVETEVARAELQSKLGRSIVTAFDWVEALIEDSAGRYDERSWTYVRKDGSRFPVALSLTILRDSEGRPTGTLGVARDITAEKAAEATQRRAREAAEQASRAKSQFVANMSHEVRTPLHAIIGVTGMLLETPLDATQRQLAETVHASTRALLAVVNRVLDFSKIEAGKLVVESVKFSPVALLREVMRLHVIRAEEKGLVLEWHVAPEVPEWVCGDPDRLRQVVHNLVGNAVKFSNHGKVRVWVEPAPPGRQRRPEIAERVRLRWSVRDSGIGIAPDAQERIFEPFAQADESMARRFGGTGLGLAIARELVELMGGEMGVESAPDVGSTFWFTAAFSPAVADIEPAGASAAEAFLPSGMALPRLRVLLVEDSEVNRLVAEHQLNHLGCTLTVVTGGREAVEAVDQGGFDLVLMDCQMPEMDGYAATAEIRRREARTGNRVRIVALTANVLEGERERCLAAGMDEYLSKPFLPGQLAGLVRAVACLVPPLAETIHVDAGELSRLRTSPAKAGPPLLARLVRIFQREAPETLAVLSAAVASGETPALTIAAHKLKGAAGNFGARRLQQLCQGVEDLSQEGLVRFIPWLLPELEAELQAVLSALENAL